MIDILIWFVAMFAGWQAAKWWDKRERTADHLSQNVANNKMDDDSRGGA